MTAAAKKAKRAAHYAANREKVLAQAAAYYAANKDKIRAYNAANKEKIAAYQAACRAGRRKAKAKAAK